jgi:hypothetical protein
MQETITKITGIIPCQSCKQKFTQMAMPITNHQTINSVSLNS